MEGLKITNINENGENNMKKRNDKWTKLLMLVMEYFALQNELTKLKIEEFGEWEPLSTECQACFAQAVEEAAREDHGFDDDFQGEWA